MDREHDLEGMGAKIRELRTIAEEMRELGKGMEAVRRNVDRILASVTMLEINVCDVVEAL